MNSLKRFADKQGVIVSALMLSVMLCVAFLFSDRLPKNKSAYSLPAEPEPDSPAEAMAWRRLARQDEFSQIAPEGLLKAIRAREDNLAYWRAHGRVGSAGLTPSSWTSRGPQNIGGRTRALIVHPNNPNLLFAAAVSGGIWRSENGGQSWAPVNDFLLNLAVNCLAIDAQNPNVMYCGTGEGFFNADAIQGAGIFKTTDSGLTWNQLPATANWNTTGKQTVNRIAIAPTNSNLILAGTLYGGIQRSIDGGVTWSQVRSAQGSFDVAFHPTDSTKAVAHLIDYNFSTNQWIHSALYSSDGGVTWSAANLNGIGTQVLGALSRIELVYAPSNPNIVYAAFDNNGNGGKLWRSTDGGQNYQLMTVSGNLSGNYWYNNTIWVSPLDPNFVVAGGVSLFKSTDGGANLTQISNGYPHPDEHFVTADPGFNGTTNKRVYVCNDGGVFRTDDIFTASDTSGWVSLNQTYQTSQYYGAAGHGTSGLIIGGTQDNGTLRSAAGDSNAGLMFGGDGGFSAIDPTDDTYCYGEYIHLQIVRSQNHGVSSSYIYQGITDAVSNANFIAPFILDPNEPNRMLAGGKSLWRSNSVRTGSPVWTAIRGPGSDNLSAIAVALGDPNLIWVAQNDGKVYLTTNGLAASPTWQTVDDNAGLNPLPNRYPTRILIDPADHNKVYVSFGGFSVGNLQRTLNGGATWTDVTGSAATRLPAAPIRGIARHPANPNWLYVGTEVGVFSSEDGAVTWAAINQGPANVSVDEIVFMHNSERLLAATHGRGVWTAEASCNFLLDPVSESFPATGGTNSIAVTAESGCGWTAIINQTWVVVTSGAVGSGNGTVNYAVAANTGPQRTGTLTIAGQTFTVTQDSGCTFTINPTSQNFAAAGGGNSVGVTTVAGCAWTATSNAAWLTITAGAPSSGNGTVNYAVAANTGPQRTGTLTIAGQTFTVTQDSGCTFTINPTSQNFAAAGGGNSVGVTTVAGCAWTATSNAAWLTITAGAPSSGNGTVNYAVAANTGPQRTGTLTIAGQTFTVTQDSGCTFTINPTSQNFAAAGGGNSVGVTTVAGCAWTATSNAAWLTITAGAPSSGNGTVNYAVAANTGPQRTGTLTIAGQTFTVTQNRGRTVKADFDGDGKTNFSVWRPANGNWHVLNSGNAATVITQWGEGLAPYFDMIVPGDYDGDGITDHAIWRGADEIWYIRKSSDGQPILQFFGTSNAPYFDIPTPGDFDGDGKTDLAVWRPSTGTYFVKKSTDGGFIIQAWGQNGDRPVAADYDGDGITDFAVWRPSDGNWLIKKSTGGTDIIQWGEGLAPYFDTPVPADYDGDGKTDLAIWRGADEIWYIRPSATPTVPILQFYGTSNAPYFDIPTPGDYDGDGKADIGVWRPSTGTWFIRRSTNGTNLIQALGQNGDKAVPANGVR